MGEKGAKLTAAASQRAAQLVDEWQPPGEVTAKKMFGGYGIFGDGVMFAIIDPAGEAFLRVGAANEAATADADVAGDPAELLEWGERALAAARAAKKK